MLPGRAGLLLIIHQDCRRLSIRRSETLGDSQSESQLTQLMVCRSYANESHMSSGSPCLMGPEVPSSPLALDNAQRLVACHLLRAEGSLWHSAPRSERSQELSGSCTGHACSAPASAASSGPGPGPTHACSAPGSSTGHACSGPGSCPGPTHAWSGPGSCIGHACGP